MDTIHDTPVNNQEQKPLPYTSPRYKRVLLFASFTLFVIIVFSVVAFVIVSQSKKTDTKVTKETKEPTVNLVTEYENPFDKKSQYVNPFSGYKNPFDSLQ
ncbi:MAG: hypothetical protein AAB702_00425 [Patescibacteria group bacterium]